MNALNVDTERCISASGDDDQMTGVGDGEVRTSGDNRTAMLRAALIARPIHLERSAECCGAVDGRLARTGGGGSTRLV